MIEPGILEQNGPITRGLNSMADRHSTAHIMLDHLGADHNVVYRPQVLSDAQTELLRQLVGQTPALRRWLLSK
jgi:hypothetical protein